MKRTAEIGQLGLANTDQAKQEFSQALQASPDHVAAKVAMTVMIPQ